MKMDVEPFYSDLGNRVREVRVAQKMTQQDLAQSIVPRVTRAAIANIEGGKQRVRAHTMWELARVLGVSPLDLAPGPAQTEKRMASLQAVQSELERQIPELSVERLTGLSKRAVNKLVVKGMGAR